MTSTPSRCKAMITSLPSSPLPSSMTRVADGDRGVPIRMFSKYFRCKTRARADARDVRADAIARRDRGRLVELCFETESIAGSAAMAAQSDYLCYTDGSCKAADGAPGGWGFVIK